MQNPTATNNQTITPLLLSTLLLIGLFEPSARKTGMVAMIWETVDLRLKSYRHHNTYERLKRESDMKIQTAINPKCLKK
jgi:hypothetical protein